MSGDLKKMKRIEKLLFKKKKNLCDRVKGLWVLIFCIFFFCSDQSDPFNRSPLTMDKVIANTELQEKIQDWIKQRKAL